MLHTCFTDAIVKLVDRLATEVITLNFGPEVEDIFVRSCHFVQYP